MAKDLFETAYSGGQQYQTTYSAGQKGDLFDSAYGGNVSAGNKFRDDQKKREQEIYNALTKPVQNQQMEKAKESLVAYDQGGSVNPWQTGLNLVDDAKKYADAVTGSDSSEFGRMKEMNKKYAELDADPNYEIAPLWSKIFGHPVFKKVRGAESTPIREQFAQLPETINDIAENSKASEQFKNEWFEGARDNADAAKALSEAGVPTYALEDGRTQQNVNAFNESYEEKSFAQKLKSDVGLTALDYALNVANAGLTAADALSGGKLSSGEGDLTSIYRIANFAQNAASGANAQAFGKMLESSNWIGRLVLQLERTGVEQAIDRAIGVLTGGGGSLVMMGVRTFGAGAQESENRGEGLGKQLLTGMARSGSELATESMSGVGGSWRGTGYIDGFLNNVDKWIGSKTGSELLATFMHAGLGEQIEEMSSDILNPLLDRILGIGEVTGRGTDTTFMQKLGHFLEDVWGGGEILYDGLLGFLSAFFGGPSSYVAYNSQAKSLAVDISTYKASQRIATSNKLKTEFEGMTGLSLSNEENVAIAQIAEYLTRVGDQTGISAQQTENELRRGGFSQNVVRSEGSSDGSGLIKNVPMQPTSAQRYVMDQLGSINETTAKLICGDHLSKSMRNAYEAAFEELTGIKLTGTTNQKVQQILKAAQEAVGAQETQGDIPAPPAPVNEATEPPVALNNNSREIVEVQEPTGTQNQAETRELEGADALREIADIEPIAQARVFPQQRAPKSARDIALWALGVDQQRQQDILENQRAVDVEAEDFDDGNIQPPQQPLTGQEALMQQAGIAPAAETQAQTDSNEDLPFIFGGGTIEQKQNGGTDNGVGEVRPSDQGRLGENKSGEQQVDSGAGQGEALFDAELERLTNGYREGQEGSKGKPVKTPEEAHQDILNLLKKQGATIVEGGAIPVDLNNLIDFVHSIVPDIPVTVVRWRGIGPAYATSSVDGYAGGIIINDANIREYAAEDGATLEQIAKHEIAHHLLRRFGLSSDDVKAYIESRVGNNKSAIDSLNNAIDFYKQSHKNRYSKNISQYGEEYANRALFEELFADLYAGADRAFKNVSGGEFSSLSSLVNDYFGSEVLPKLRSNTPNAEIDAFLNEKDAENAELQLREEQRKQDEFDELRRMDKQQTNAAEWARDQRAKAKADEALDQMIPKHDPERDMGSEGYAALKRENAYLQKAVSTEGKTSDGKPDVTKRVFSDRTFGVAKDAIESFEKFVNGTISFAEFADEYEKLEHTAFYEERVSEAIKAAKEAIERDENNRIQEMGGELVDKASRSGGQLSSDTIKAINDAAQLFTHRISRDGHIGIEERSTFNSAVKEAAQKNKTRAKSVAGLIEKFNGLQLRPDVMFEHLAGFAKSSPLYQLAEDHKQAIKDKQNSQQTALEYFAAATKMKGYNDFASGKTKIKNPVPGYGESEMSLNVALCLLKTLETEGAINHIARYGAQFAANEGELYSGKHNSGFGDKTTYGKTLSLLSEKTQALMDQAHTGKDIAHARATAELELKALVKTLKAEVMKNEVSASMYRASSQCMKYLARNMNNTSQLLWGEDFATQGDSYFPMEWVSDAQNYQLLNDPRGGLKGMGIVQEREGDKQPLRIRTFTDVMGRYIDQSTDWSAFSDLSDRLELMSRNNPGHEASLTATIGEQYGRFYADWLNKYVQDLNGTRERGSQLMSELRSNLAAASLTLNGGVALKQSPSYFDAAGIIDMGILIKHAPGLLKTYRSFENNALIQEVTQRTGMLGVRKSGGNVVSEATENARSLSGRVNKFLPGWMTDWITRTDVRTTSNLMLACADQVLSDDPNLKQGTEGFYQAVANKFEEVILKSQPVYTRQARAEYMRSNNEVVRTLAMFRTQQTQNFNQLIEAIGEYRNAGDQSKSKAAKHLRQVLGGQVAANVMFGILSAVAKAGLHKLDDFKDKEGEFKVSAAAKRIGLNTLGAIAGTVWLGNQFESVLVDIASRGKTSEFYGVEDNAISLLSDIASAMISFAKKPSLKTGSTMAFNVSQALGLPVKNAYNLLNSAAMFALDINREKTGGFVWDDGKSSDLIKMIQTYNEQSDKKRAAATFNAAMRALSKGDSDRFDTLMSTLDYENVDVTSAIKSEAKQQYLLGEITKQQYERILKEYGGMDSSAAAKYADGQEEKKEYNDFLESDDKYKELDSKIDDAKARAKEYDTTNDRAAMDEIIKATLPDSDTDKLVDAKLSSNFNTVYDALRGAGQSPKQAYDTYKALDTDSNGNLKQAEVYTYYVNNPGMEHILQRIWTSKGWKTSWADYKAKQK